MGVAQDHPDVGPSAQFLQHLDRCSGHDVPCGPGVAKVVPCEIMKSCTPAGAREGVTDFAHRADARLASDLLALVRVGKNPIGVRADLASQDVDGFGAQWNADRLAGFCLVGVDPHDAPAEVDLVPAQAQDVGLAQAGGDGEARERAQVLR